MDIFVPEIRWIIYQHCDTQQLFEFESAFRDPVLFNNEPFWNRLWAQRFEKNDAHGRTQQLIALLTYPMSGLFACSDSVKDLKHQHVDDVLKIKILCRTRLDMATCTPHNLGLWARSRNFFTEAEKLFEQQQIHNDDQKYIITDVSAANCLGDGKSHRTHGRLVRPRNSSWFVFCGLRQLFIERKYVQQQANEIVCDKISPLIRNPFRFYLPFVQSIIESPPSTTPEKQATKQALHILYPAVHQTAINELFEWYLSLKNKHNLIPFAVALDHSLIQSVCWAATGGNNVTVKINFGFELIDYIKLQQPPVEGEWMLDNPFDYLECYARDTSLESVGLRPHISPNTVIYHGRNITLSTQCQSVTRSWDLASQNGCVTFEQLGVMMRHLYTSPLSLEEYQANMFLDEEDVNGHEDFAFGKASFVSFVFNHHHVIALKGQNHEFICECEENS